MHTITFTSGAQGRGEAIPDKNYFIMRQFKTDFILKQFINVSILFSQSLSLWGPRGVRRLPQMY